MPEAVLIDFPTGMDAALYDQVNDRVNPPGGRPEGLLFHCAGPSPNGGWRVIDVWDSRATFDAFIETKVMPTMAELIGEEALAKGAPTIESWPTHNLER